MKPTLLIVLAMTVTTLFGQQPNTKEAFLEKWENSKNYLLEIAEAMPENAYDFSPTDRQMTFREQLMHIKSNMEWLGTSYFSNEHYERSTDTVTYSKKEVLRLLDVAFNQTLSRIKRTPNSELSEVVEFFAGPKSKLQILNLIQDHVTHHRGQLIVYLNLQGIEPPRYIGW